MAVKRYRGPLSEAERTHVAEQLRAAVADTRERRNAGELDGSRLTATAIADIARGVLFASVKRTFDDLDDDDRRWLANEIAATLAEAA